MNTNKHGDQGQAQKVLVVDDNNDSADTMGTLLELEGFVVEIARDGAQALELFERTSPDIILLDIGLPDISGYEVALRIRAHPMGKSVLLIALTGYGRDEDKLAAEQAGFDRHLAKPIDIDLLLPLLREG